MSLVATWRGWHLFFDRIKSSRSEEVNRARHTTTGLDKLVESGNDPRDYSFTTLFIQRSCRKIDPDFRKGDGELNTLSLPNLEKKRTDVSECHNGYLNVYLKDYITNISTT